MQPDDEEADEPDEVEIDVISDDADAVEDAADGSVEASEAPEESPVGGSDPDDAASADEAEEKAEA